MDGVKSFEEIRREVRRYFDDLAPRWDAIIDPDHAPRLGMLLSGITWEQPVLDVGAGTGIMWEVLRSFGVPRQVIVAVDIAPRMLAAPRSAPPDRVAADVHDLPFARDQFGTVVCNSCLPHFDQLDRALAELGWVLRPGGLLVVCHSEPREAINRRHREIGGVVGTHELPEADTLGSMLRSCGMVPEVLQDGPQGYLVTARKRS